ncbi:MAG: 23S rRNA (adenine(2503)-C(2))-methyltransferase RlmN, partial [Anaerolineales bacterium]|nr:23S rRNA (adenine(2503)-C(2))-methyltransferase RlmN [Anaerolineales bacterium]
MSLLHDLSLPALTALLQDWGEPAYRARQIWEGLYHHFYTSADEFTSLPKSLRLRLSETFNFAPLTPVTQMTSRDGQTVKTLFRLPDGLHIEAVLMKYDRRRTLCISTQAGCAMGCVFCATGQMGFKRHLSGGEIVAQVMYYARLLHEQGERVTNIVVMGMGEPFHNYDNTMAAIDRLNDPQGYNFGARRITISTVGLVPAIRRFTAEKRQVNLAISLHAAEDSLRASLLPVAKAYPLDELLAACRDYVATTGRRMTFEWALIEGINDTPEQARLLASKVK